MYVCSCRFSFYIQTVSEHGRSEQVVLKIIQCMVYKFENRRKDWGDVTQNSSSGILVKITGMCRPETIPGTHFIWGQYRKSRDFSEMWEVWSL